jgi:hypothetical protein
VLSRTTGLPGFHESDWELSGLISLVLELGFVAVAVRGLTPTARGRERGAGLTA